MTIAVDSATGALLYDPADGSLCDDCCEEVPICCRYQVTFSGVLNQNCSSCSDYNRVWPITEELSACQSINCPDPPPCGPGGTTLCSFGNSPFHTVCGDSGKFIDLIAWVSGGVWWVLVTTDNGPVTTIRWLGNTLQSDCRNIDITMDFSDMCTQFGAQCNFTSATVRVEYVGDL